MALIRDTATSFRSGPGQGMSRDSSTRSLPRDNAFLPWGNIPHYRVLIPSIRSHCDCVTRTGRFPC